MTSQPAFKTRMRSVVDLAAEKPCGNRIRYMSGCRCMLCRAANTSYETMRAAARRRGEWNGLVDAGKARHQLIMLSRRGIGRDTVADITGISPSTLDLYRTGKRKQLRAMNEKAILAIEIHDVLNDAMLVSAVKTWERIRWLLRQGFTKTELARRLGYKAPSLQLNKERITARNALKIERFYNIIRAGDPELEGNTDYWTW